MPDRRETTFRQMLIRAFVMGNRSANRSPRRREGGVRVLVADRSGHYREAACRVLEQTDYCELAGTAASLAKAVSLAAREQPDVVLLDFGLVAREDTTRLRALARRFASLKIIVLLDDDSEGYRDAVQSRWGYPCIAKDRLAEHVALVVADLKLAVR